MELFHQERSKSSKFQVHVCPITRDRARLQGSSATLLPSFPFTIAFFNARSRLPSREPIRSNRSSARSRKKYLQSTRRDAPRSFIAATFAIETIAKRSARGPDKRARAGSRFNYSSRLFPRYQSPSPIVSLLAARGIYTVHCVAAELTFASARERPVWRRPNPVSCPPCSRGDVKMLGRFA